MSVGVGVVVNKDPCYVACCRACATEVTSGYWLFMLWAPTFLWARAHLTRHVVVLPRRVVTAAALRLGHLHALWVSALSVKCPVARAVTLVCRSNRGTCSSINAGLIDCLIADGLMLYWQQGSYSRRKTCGIYLFSQSCQSHSRVYVEIYKKF